MVVSLVNPGIVQPNASPAPFQGQDLNRFLQNWIVGLTGLANNLVIPEQQAEPPIIPDAGNAFASFRYETIDQDAWPFIGFVVPANGNSYQDLKRHELLEVSLSFYDLGTSGLAASYTSLTKDNLAIDANSFYLQNNGYNLRGMGTVKVVPVVFKSRWQYREILPILIARNVERQYPTSQVTQANVKLLLDGLLVTGFPSSNIPAPITPPFSPLALSNLGLWLDPSDASTIVFGTNPAINILKDKSGNFNNAFQNTAANQPTQVVAAQNGLNTIQGVSANNQFFSLTSPITQFPYTLAYIGKKVVNTNALAVLGSLGGLRSWACLDNNDGFTSFTDAPGSANNLTTVAIPFTSAYYNNIIVSNGLDNGQLYRNGVAQILNYNAVASTSAPLDSIFKNGAAISDGFLGEILYYNRALNPNEITQVYSYLKNKWGTP